MKRLYALFFVTVASTVSLFAQSASVEFAPIGARWKYTNWSGITYTEDIYESCKETEIDGRMVRVISQIKTTSFGSPQMSPSKVDTDEEFLYVYNIADTVYVSQNRGKSFFRAFVYNVSEGDVVTLQRPTGEEYDIKVESVTEIENGLKKYYVNVPQGEKQLFIDKVGGYDGYFFPQTIVNYMKYYLQSYTENGVEINLSMRDDYDAAEEYDPYASVDASMFAPVGTSWSYDMGENRDLLFAESVGEKEVNGKMVRVVDLVEVLYMTHKKMTVKDYLYVYNDCDTVYASLDKGATFFKMLVFNVKQGDTIALQKKTGEEYRIFIDAVTTTTTGLKKYDYHILNGYETEQYSYIDKFGSIDDLLFPKKEVLFGGNSSYILRTYTHDGVTYKIDFEEGVQTDVEDVETLSIVVYPNPVDETLNIDTEKEIVVLLYAIDGNLLIKGKENQIDFTSLGRGVYVLKIIGDDGTTYTERVLRR